MEAGKDNGDKRAVTRPESKKVSPRTLDDHNAAAPKIAQSQIRPPPASLHLQRPSLSFRAERGTCFSLARIGHYFSALQ